MSLKIPLETQGGRAFRLKGQGMPRLRDSNKRGDLYAKVKVVLPKGLSAKEKALFGELAQMRGKGNS
jgi:DnaJ-class molecular chaperone